MGKINRHQHVMWVLGLAFVGLFMLMAWMNQMLVPSEKTEKLRQMVVPVKASVVAEVPKKERPVVVGEVTRKVHLDPGRQFAISIFYADGEEIARYKSHQDTIYDFEGHIPDGKVAFYNVSDQTSGVEYYRDGKRHGEYLEYYDNINLKCQAEYSQGKVNTRQEYYSDGILRMEEDYTDPMLYVDDPEKGSGKVYFRNGTLMYEWHLTSQDENRYKKSYNRDGVLVEIKTYDEYGVLTEKKNFRKKTF